MDADALSPVAQDYLKVIWSAVEWGDPPITTTGLAERFGTSRANVSDVMRRLQAQGLVEYQPYHPVTLTPTGERLAVAMVRRHRLIEQFLAEVLHYGWDEVHDDAERLEHAVSPRFLASIDALLGHPTTDPHGDPIPTREGRWHVPDETLILSEAEPGTYRVIRVSDADPDALARLRVAGLRPGATVVVGSSTVDVIDATGRPAVVVPGDGAMVRVRPTS